MSAAGMVAGCAANPVTGKKQLMLVSREQEIQMDRQYAPMHLSSDYGKVQDLGLNQYVDSVGQSMAAKTHRPDMPYSFRVVNATYVNAYAFPGGTIACTRGIMLALENEAELAALLGHELGHVNARHSAEQMSKGMITQTVVGGLAVLAGTQGAAYGQVASQLGSIGAGALLASYSRDNEREADDLGMRYMVGSGYNPQGMVGLMDVLRSMSKHKPSTIDLMFATHPMSDERYQTAVTTVRKKYAAAGDMTLQRDRYMDHTAKLRRQREAVEALQDGEKELYQKKFDRAEAKFGRALGVAPNDYAGLIMMSKCQLLQSKHKAGLDYAKRARTVYPQEAQAYHLIGFAQMNLKDYESAYQNFGDYQQRLPLDPNPSFFRGYCQEQMQHREAAAREYQAYLKNVQQGKYAQYAYSRMVEWGYYQKP
jgi:predicted Zn-dependent protease